MVKQGEQKRVQDRVVVTERDQAGSLGKLADAVRGQNTGKLVQKPEQPAEEQTEEPAEEEAPAAEAQNRETRVTESVNIRSEASTDSDRIALAYQGDAITQIESYDNGWSKVEYKGETGYVKTEFLE